MSIIDEDFAMAFDFWDDIPIIKEYPDEIINRVIEGTTRKIILDILVKGVEEIHPNLGVKRIRRALSVTEIYDRLNGNSKKGIEGILPDDTRIKRNNLYFHLDKMMEFKFIKEIVKTETGRRSTTYFGRCSKIMVPVHKEGIRINDLPILQDNNFNEFLKRIHPDIDNDKLSEIILKSNEINDHTYFIKVETWINNMERYTRGLEMDLRELFNLIGFLSRLDEQTFHALQELGKLLNVPKRG
ncbi:MAG: hypothetical protein INQ03_19835 [Candidatus Heimdallarchaeota archaeon]|nr:hypothetical protein [Candidatus Heimdallarchaeota archaeon]